jgi:hypothetical protein
MESDKTAVGKQRLGKNIPAPINTHGEAEMLDEVFSTWPASHEVLSM